MPSTHDSTVLTELQRRGLLAQCSHQAALDSLLEAGQAICYLGVDPTSESLHVGHLLPIKLMERLVQSGQKGIILLGSGTACIGDPSGKTETRQMMDYEQIQKNATHIRQQIASFLSHVELCYLDNSEWILSLRYVDFLRSIGKHFSVNRMLSFESYKARMEKGLSFIEFNYQLLQAYDYYHLHRTHGCNVQIGGDDQWGNMVAGMDLIRRMTGAESEVFTVPLVTTAKGTKMGKTEKGAIFLDAEKTSIFDFYQYWRNVDDKDVRRFLLYYTSLPVEEVEVLTHAAGPSLNKAKELLAYELTKDVHGEAEAVGIQDATRSMFKDGGVQRALPSTSISALRLQQGVLVTELLVESKLCRSMSDARRLIAGGGARIQGQKIHSHEMLIRMQDLQEGQILLQAGKKKFFCFQLAESSS